jgi:hypothetical protein
MVRSCFTRYAVLIFLLNLTPALTLSMVVAAADDGVKSPSQVEMEKREGMSEPDRPSHDLYDRLASDVVHFCWLNPRPIPHRRNPEQYR